MGFCSYDIMRFGISPVIYNEYRTRAATWAAKHTHTCLYNVYINWLNYLVRIIKKLTRFICIELDCQSTLACSRCTLKHFEASFALHKYPHAQSQHSLSPTFCLPVLCVRFLCFHASALLCSVIKYSWCW